MDGSCRPGVDHCEVQVLGLWSDLNDNAFDVVHLQGRAKVQQYAVEDPIIRSAQRPLELQH